MSADALRSATAPAPVETVARLVGARRSSGSAAIGAELPGVRIYAKCEFANPGGSVKDRARAAHDRGRARATAGSARADARRLDERQHRRRLRLDLRRARGPLRARDAEERVARRASGSRRRSAPSSSSRDPLEGSDGAIRKVRELVEAEPDRWFYPDQYGNAENPRAHEHGTAVEIAEALDGAVAAFVAGIGTSGTVMGTSRGLRALAPGVRCFAVEPAEPLHGLEGLKHMASSIVPAIYGEAELDGKLSGADRGGLGDGGAARARGGAPRRPLRGRGRRGRARDCAADGGGGRAGNVVTVLPDRADRYFEPRRWDRRTPGEAPPTTGRVVARLAALCEADPEREVCGLRRPRAAARSRWSRSRTSPTATTRATPRGSRARAATRYLMDPRTSSASTEELEAGGGEIVGGLALARRGGRVLLGEGPGRRGRGRASAVPGAEYLVLGVRGGRVTEVKRFRWDGRDFVEAPLT